MLGDLDVLRTFPVRMLTGCTCAVQMERAKQYHAKLINIKKDMSLLHDKTAQLKVSAFVK